MATGVKPRDEDIQFTRSDLENIQEAMKNKTFRDLLVDYCEEVRDPANQALYQKEMTQLEKERGYDVKFINPKGGYVIKTSVAGDRKAFINICSNENIERPSSTAQEVNGQRGINWQLPYSIIPPREDYDHKKGRCIIYDVVFHPDTLRMAEVNKQFRELVNKTAYEGLQKTYNIHFDSNNFKFPRSHYKGNTVPAVIRKEDPDYVPPSEEDQELPAEVLEKLYPQHCYPEDPTEIETNKPSRISKTKTPEFSHASEQGYTVPKYVIKQQKNVDFQDYTYHKNSKQYAAIPSHIVVEINLPLLSSTNHCILDVHEKALSLKSERPAKYKLDITLPYVVNDEFGIAKFDKSRRILKVTLPVTKQSDSINNNNSSKVDSGVESEQSDEDNTERKVVELSSTSTEPIPVEGVTSEKNNLPFFDHNLSYILPEFTHNVLDDIVALTFHVKNTEPDSVKVEKIGNSKIYIKFTSVGSGFVPVYYAAVIKFDDSISFDNVSGESWDNNVILQLELCGEAPQKFEIGLHESDMTVEEFDVSQITKVSKPAVVDEVKHDDVENSPMIEVTNLGTETNIIVSSNQNDIEEDLDDDDDIDSLTSLEKIVWIDSGCNESGAKSILRKPRRSLSESSVGDIASSMDYISSDCIPEEGSLKKTVRFKAVIEKQFYRFNSSIEGQKKKNQRKKHKKRNQERRKSESEGEEKISSSAETPKTRSKSLKQRRDSGLADTSDADECKNDGQYSKTSDQHESEDAKNVDDNNISAKSILNIVGHDQSQEALTPKETVRKSKSKPKFKKGDRITCDNLKHNTDLYNPDQLNKGKYLDVAFKNDLIFDLDM